MKSCNGSAEEKCGKIYKRKENRPMCPLKVRQCVLILKMMYEKEEVFCFMFSGH